MELEVGKKYRLNNGEERVCDHREAAGFRMGAYWYYVDGRCGGFSAYAPLSVACEVTDDQYKPLSEFAPFKAGERFRDERGDVLEILPVCDRYDWVKIGKVRCEAEAPGVSVALSSTKVTPLDRDDDTPKLWRDMTDAEKGALLLAEHEEKKIEWNIPVSDHTGEISGWKWVECENVGYSPKFAYRVRPKPSFLPLEAGKTYQTAEEGNWECIHVNNGSAWLKRFDGSPAYVWDADTGFAKCLGEKYDITGLEEG